MKLLLVDNNIADRGAADLRRELLRAGSLSVETRRGPESDLPQSVNAYSGLVISGSRTSILDTSAWVGELENLICRFMDRQLPVLGICFGHQMIARTLGGKPSVRVSPTSEHGWSLIRTHAGSQLFDGLPPTFYSFSSHFEEVVSAPPHAHIIASSDRCAIQGFEVQGKSVFGIQFHPEKNLEETVATLSRWKVDKKTKRTFQLPNDSKQCYNSLVSEKIFPNFVRSCK